MTTTRRAAGAALFCTFAAFLGCSSGPQTGTVFGTVTLDDKPVNAGTITFVAKAGGEPVSAFIQPNGTYRLGGVPAGEVLVGLIPAVPDNPNAGEVVKRSAEGAQPKGVKSSAPPPPVQFPKRYADPGSSTLTTKVTADGETQFDVKMTK